MEGQRVRYLNSPGLHAASVSIHFNTATDNLAQYAAKVGIGFVMGTQADCIAPLYDEDRSGSIATLDRCLQFTKMTSPSQGDGIGETCQAIDHESDRLDLY
jgi:hypothetical protein